MQPLNSQSIPKVVALTIWLSCVLSTAYWAYLFSTDQVADLGEAVRHLVTIAVLVLGGLFFWLWRPRH